MKTTTAKITSGLFIIALVIACGPKERHDMPRGPETHPDSVSTVAPADRDTTSADSTDVR